MHWGLEPMVAVVVLVSSMEQVELRAHSRGLQVVSESKEQQGRGEWVAWVV